MSEGVTWISFDASVAVEEALTCLLTTLLLLLLLYDVSTAVISTGTFLDSGIAGVTTSHVPCVL
jgi:hypothetical protein